MTLTIEPINRQDMPDYFLCDYDLALGIIEEVAAPNLYLQFDAYHAQRITGDMLGTWEAVRHRVGHIQIAGVPMRHEPDSGELNHAYLFEVIDEVAAESGWAGWVAVRREW